MKAIEVRVEPIRLVIAAAMATGLLLAGCSRGHSDDEAEANAAANSEVNIPIPTEPAVPAITDGPDANASGEKPAPADALSEDAQMMEDAEATGMTSRLPAGTAEEAPANAATEGVAE